MSTQMQPCRIVTVVEGHGEVEALPLLLWRIAAEVAPHAWVEFPRPHRVGRDSLLTPHGIESTLSTVLGRTPGVSGVLVLFDSDDDCPATVGPHLLDRLRKARPDIPTAVVLAHREFEAWFLAAAPSLAGQQGLRPDLAIPDDPESIRGCKEWLTRSRTDGMPYKARRHQPGLAAAFDISLARDNSPSFDKLYREVSSLLKRAEPR